MFCECVFVIRCIKEVPPVLEQYSSVTVSFCLICLDTVTWILDPINQNHGDPCRPESGIQKEKPVIRIKIY